MGAEELVAGRCSFVAVDVVVDATAADAGLAGPRVDVRAGLARLHVAHAALVPEVADLRVVALLRPVLSLRGTAIRENLYSDGLCAWKMIPLVFRGF